MFIWAGTIFARAVCLNKGKKTTKSDSYSMAYPPHSLKVHIICLVSRIPLKGKGNSWNGLQWSVFYFMYQVGPVFTRERIVFQVFQVQEERARDGWVWCKRVNIAVIINCGYILIILCVKLHIFGSVMLSYARSWISWRLHDHEGCYYMYIQLYTYWRFTINLL